MTHLSASDSFATLALYKFTYLLTYLPFAPGPMEACSPNACHHARLCSPQNHTTPLVFAIATRRQGFRDPCLVMQCTAVSLRYRGFHTVYTANRKHPESAKLCRVQVGPCIYADVSAVNPVQFHCLFTGQLRGVTQVKTNSCMALGRRSSEKSLRFFLAEELPIS